MRAVKALPIDRGLARIEALLRKPERSNVAVRCPYHNSIIVARGLEPHLVNEHGLTPQAAALLRARAVRMAEAG